MCHQILWFALVDSQTEDVAVREGSAYGSQRFFLSVLDDGHPTREVDDTGRGIVEDELLRTVSMPMNLAQL